MNNTSFLEYAEDQKYVPLIWFDINYPTFAVKVKYSYPTSDPADFRDRALLQLIDLGMPYSTACAILMVNDPHQTILERFKSDTSGPQLVHFDKALNNLALTPMGKHKVERIELAKDGVACCFIDGFSGAPFPIDVINGLSDRFICSDIKNNPGGLYPFDPNIEQRLVELNAKLNDNKGRRYSYRLGIPEKSKETSMSLLSPKWMRNLSIGIFLDDQKIVRKIFCDKATDPISPFGWLENLSAFKLTGNGNNRRFSYIKEDEENTNAFTKVSSDSLRQLYEYSMKKEYGSEFLQNLNLSVDMKTGQCTIEIQHLDATTRNRSKILSFIEKGIMPIPLPGLVGTAFIKVQGTQEINNLSRLRNEINQSNVDWHQIIKRLQDQDEDSNNWRQILIAIDRHDLLFRHDVEKYIKYGK